MLKKTVDRFVPDLSNSESEYQRRVRLIAYALFITSVFSLFYVIVSWMAGFTVGIIVMGFAFIVFSSLLILLRLGINMFVIANLFGFSGIVAISTCIYFSGGSTSPILPWLATTPIVILLLAGKRSGSFWAICSVTVMVLFTVMGSYGYVFPKAFATDNVTFNLSCNVGLVLIIFFISIVFENVRINAFNKVSSQKDELEETLHELRAAQSQLIQSEKMASLGELTAGIAHEIQNPLNFVNNFSELNKELAIDLQKELTNGNVEEAMAISEDIKSNAEKIVIHGNRADAIVKGMLQHSRKSTGQKEFTDINALCEESIRLSYHGLRAKEKNFHADFKTSFDPEVGSIKVMPQEISRVILNLLNNAFYAVNAAIELKGNDYKPLVSLTTRKTNSPSDDECVEIIVSDNGTGIPKKVIDKIFQPFFTTKPAGQGTGLGLSLSYDIITKGHNGTIKVETVEGKGADFIIQLPVSA
jgi:two-component system NtrC family sensor kinase